MDEKMSTVPLTDVAIISYWYDITSDAREKNLTIVVDEYTPEFRVRDDSQQPYVVIGSATSLERLHEIIDAWNGIQT